MCDVSKFSSMYEEMKKLTPEDTPQLILEVETEDQKAFLQC